MIKLKCDRCPTEQSINSVEDYLDIISESPQLCDECQRKYRELVRELREYRSHKIKEFMAREKAECNP